MYIPAGKGKLRIGIKCHITATECKAASYVCAWSFLKTLLHMMSDMK